MEPLNDRELSQLLKKWEAPETPHSLRSRIFPRRMSWRQWLVSGTIRVPVPVGFAAVIVLMLWFYFSKPTVQPSSTPVPGPVTLADFQPVKQLEPVRFGEIK